MNPSLGLPPAFTSSSPHSSRSHSFSPLPRLSLSTFCLFEHGYWQNFKASYLFINSLWFPLASQSLKRYFWQKIQKQTIISSLLCPHVLRKCLTGLLRLHNSLYIRLEKREWFTLGINFLPLSTSSLMKLQRKGLHLKQSRDMKHSWYIIEMYSTITHVRKETKAARTWMYSLVFLPECVVHVVLKHYWRKTIENNWNLWIKNFSNSIHPFFFHNVF